MTKTICTALAELLLLIGAAFANAEYTETMKSDALTKNLATDYALVDDGGSTDQSPVFQKAVDEIAALGGGRLIVPKGTYTISDVAIKSNVHVLIEAGTVIKPLRTESGNGKWAFEIGRDGPVENVSVRGLKGRFTFSLTDFTQEDRVRTIALGDVTNFLISDIDVKDNFTIFSAIILSSPDSTKTGFVGPTNGTIRNCSTYNASIGYGLAQAHAAKNVLFENLYALGGVAMRLECGVRPKNPEQKNGIFDVRGKNIKCENGYVALLLGPHSTPCGVVTVDGIEAISCEFAAKFTNGFISARKKHEGDEPGYFAKGTSIKNVRAVFGMTAQRSPLHLKYTHPELRKHVAKDRPRALKGPAVTAILDQANYDVEVEKLTAEGYENIKPIISKQDAFTDRGLKSWAGELTEYVKGPKE